MRDSAEKLFCRRVLKLAGCDQRHRSDSIDPKSLKQNKQMKRGELGDVVMMSAVLNSLNYVDAYRKFCMKLWGTCCGFVGTGAIVNYVTSDVSMKYCIVHEY